jgi:tRNA dimethylallyltransferase
LEVIRLTGKPYSQQQADWSESRLKIRAGTLICLKRSSADLAKRISTRVDEMFRRGLVRETEELLKHGLAENRTAMQALGYRQVVEHLRGARSLSETVELVKIRTRQFAKRQMTWFRKYGAWDWINLNPDESVDLTVQRLLERI